MIEKSIPEDLPPGWVKELKTTKNGKGIRKDPVWKNNSQKDLFLRIIRYIFV